MRYVNGTRLDDRIIRTDWDHGFKEGRQYGRGKSGGQVMTFMVKLVKSLPDNSDPIYGFGFYIWPMPNYFK